MILGCLAGVAPRTDRTQVVVVVRASRFERNRVVQIPAIGRPQFAGADRAFAAALGENTGALLWRSWAALLVYERTHAAVSFFSASIGTPMMLSIISADAFRITLNCVSEHLLKAIDFGVYSRMPFAVAV